MNAPHRGAALNIEADLHIEIDGRSASLTGTGQSLVLTSATPQYFWASLNQVALPAAVGVRHGARALGQIADALESQGLAFHVVGPAGEIAHLGTNANSRWSRLFTGSSRIQVGSLRTLTNLAAGLVRQSRLLRPGLAAAAVLGIAGIAGTVARRAGRGTV